MIRLAAVFISTLCYGVVFRSPRAALVPAGLTGALAWAGYAALPTRPVLGVFLGAALAGLSGEYLARLLRMPALVFTALGVIDLVPGVTAYRAMLAFVEGNYSQGLALTVQVVVVGGAIAGGLALVAVTVRQSLILQRLLSRLAGVRSKET